MCLKFKKHVYLSHISQSRITAFNILRYEHALSITQSHLCHPHLISLCLTLHSISSHLSPLHACTCLTNVILCYSCNANINSLLIFINSRSWEWILKHALTKKRIEILSQEFNKETLFWSFQGPLCIFSPNSSCCKIVIVIALGTWVGFLVVIS